MALDIHIGLDLGSDTLKIAYAYRDRNSEYSGKIVCDATSMTAIPAVAYYDFEEETWLFGEDVDCAGDKSYVSVVKIKNLLSLLVKNTSREVSEGNARFYFEGNKFPKFYFPVRRKMLADFTAMAADNRTFDAPGVTPADICGRFFAYVQTIVVERARQLARRHGETSFRLIASYVYPPYAGLAYRNELKRLIEAAFGPTGQALSMPKALSAFAIRQKQLTDGEHTLVFNLGEEMLSVVKANLQSTGLSIDGVDGHSEPIPLGGNNIDDAVAQYLERQMSDRETMGQPASGEEGHLAESSLNTKQYLFGKEIKTAKLILGMSLYGRGAFAAGVPVTVSRDLLIQRRITREQFVRCIGITEDTGVARRIADYILTEVRRPINADVRRIFLSGGTVETYGLVAYLKQKIEPTGIRVDTFEYADGAAENDGFHILPHEDAVYAPALGCAFAALNGLEIRTVLALSYGLRLYRDRRPFLKLLVNKGDVLPPEGAQFLIPRPNETRIAASAGTVNSAEMRVVSTLITERDIASRRYEPQVAYFRTNEGKSYLHYDPSDSKAAERLKTLIGLKAIGPASSNGYIFYYYDGVRVRLETDVNLRLGVSIDGDGRAKPFAENDTDRNAAAYANIIYSQATYRSGSLVHGQGETARVPARDIVFDFDIDDFDIFG